MKGYTLFEMLSLLMVLVAIGLFGAIIYVLFHFVAKFW
jgi:hypothetical protein